MGDGRAEEPSATGDGGRLSHSVVSDSATPCTVAHQAPLFRGFPRQEYWSGLPFPSPGDLPDPGIQPRSPALQTDSSLTELPGGGQVAISLTPGADGAGSVFLLDSILSTLFKR